MKDIFSDYLGAYLQRAYAAPLLSVEEETALATQMEAGGALGARARDKLITAHLKMVVPVARKFMGYGVPLEDLIQEGNTGLLRAADKFDRHSGNRFSTYAWFWVRAAIKDYASDNHSTVRIPATKRKAPRRLQEGAEGSFRQPGTGDGGASCQAHEGVRQGCP